MTGLTGKVSFDTEGFRSSFQLDIVELRKEGLVQVQYCTVYSTGTVLYRV